MLSKIKAVFILVIASGINEVVKLTYIKNKNAFLFLILDDEVFNLFLFLPNYSFE